jgi:hypothetical protein
MARRGERLLDLIQGYYPGYHPIVSLTDIAQDEGTPVSLRYLCHKTILRYIEPEVKAVEYLEEKRVDNYVRVKLFGSNIDESNDILEDKSNTSEYEDLSNLGQISYSRTSKDAPISILRSDAVYGELSEDYGLDDMKAEFEAEIATGGEDG